MNVRDALTVLSRDGALTPRRPRARAALAAALRARKRHTMGASPWVRLQCSSRGVEQVR